jgi:hypothetical protein
MNLAGSLPNAGAAERTFFVRMIGGINLPGGGDPDGEASGFVTVNDETGLVAWDIQYANLDTLNAMHIHRGLPGMSGPVIVDMGIETIGGPGTLIDSTTHPNLTELTTLTNDPLGHYVAIHTIDHPLGAVRGQFTFLPVPTLSALGNWLAMGCILSAGAFCFRRCRKGRRELEKSVTAGSRLGGSAC